MLSKPYRTCPKLMVFIYFCLPLNWWGNIIEFYVRWLGRIRVNWSCEPSKMLLFSVVYLERFNQLFLLQSLVVKLKFVPANRKRRRWTYLTQRGLCYCEIWVITKIIVYIGILAWRVYYCFLIGILSFDFTYIFFSNTF